MRPLVTIMFCLLAVTWTFAASNAYPNFVIDVDESTEAAFESSFSNTQLSTSLGVRQEPQWPIWEIIGMALVAMTSVVPLSLRNRWKSWQLYLPILSLALWFVYTIDLVARMPGPIIGYGVVELPLFCIPAIATIIRIRIIRQRSEDDRFSENQKRLKDAVKESKQQPE